MLAPMKKRRIDQVAKITWQGEHYAVPLNVMKKFKVTNDEDKTFSVEEIFADLLNEPSEPGVLLKGLRYKNDLSQIEFAKIIGVSQTNLSAMENGRRTIGKEIAKRIAKHFGVDYRLFL